jgi:pSer/pThr/pTyr-binding forkhead associated (FHA) protein
VRTVGTASRARETHNVSRVAESPKQAAIKAEVAPKSAPLLGPNSRHQGANPSITQAYLESEDGGEAIPLKADFVRVGSDPDSSIILNDPAVSGRHVAFRNLEGHWLLQDLGSTNGT